MGIYKIFIAFFDFFSFGQEKILLILLQMSALTLRIKKLIKSFITDNSRIGECKTTLNSSYVSFSPFKRENLCLVAHYSSTGIVHQYFLYYIEKLKDCGFDVVVCSSTAILETEIVKLKESAVGILFQENYGWDFGLWKSALLRFKNEIRLRTQLKSILITNDSVYGPLTDLNSIFSEMQDKEIDLWGMSESFEVSSHMQSYFIVFNQRVIQSDFFWSFWEDVKYYFDKRAVISNYELRLGKLFLDKGFQWSAYISKEKIQKASIQNNVLGKSIDEINPTLQLWEPLIYSFNFPFVKGELLRKRMIPKGKFEKMMNYLSISGYPISYIEDHLKSVR
ncbi:hypothetical protein EHR10_18140 [Leptospira yasudae]|nr:hypothetical protein EHR10_18140 [Leptospira yasudae]